MNLEKSLTLEIYELGEHQNNCRVILKTQVKLHEVQGKMLRQKNKLGKRTEFFLQCSSRNIGILTHSDLELDEEINLLNKPKGLDFLFVCVSLGVGGLRVENRK